MAGRAASAIKSGSTEVVTAKTAVQLVAPVKSPNLDRNAIGVWVSGDYGNAGAVVVGDSTVKATTKECNGIVLPKGALGPVFIETEDPTTLYVDAETSKDKVAYLILYR